MMLPNKVISLNLLLIAVLLFQTANAQICGTPGLDGPANISISINTYFPPLDELVLSAGSKKISLAAVPPDDPYGNNFGTKTINPGDLLLIIQMQDASLNYTNDLFYGSNNPTSGPDLLGGTGYTELGNTGKFEYVIATSTVALAGGTLTFRGMGAGNGTVNTYVNAAATLNRGARTFQIVRVPQYSNLTLSQTIKTPPFNGKAGGIIAFDVAGTMNFNGFVVDASARGFRGGYGPVADSGNNIGEIYVTPSTDTRSTGKGEGIAGTPRYMWDGFNMVNNIIEGLPAGSYGRGAPGNAGGGGNDHNSGGGGGGNGGAGGVGGNGVITNPRFDTYPNGGRPGSSVYDLTTPDLSCLIMGGGGGGGDANDAEDGVKGGVGGGIVLINAGKIMGTGTILSNGSNGAVGVFGTQPDGAGGGGAGGTIFVKVINPDPSALLTIMAKGGDGGNTERDPSRNRGPGGGGGGGQVFVAMPSTSVNINTTKGKAGQTANGSNRFSSDGQNGNERNFNIPELPAYLQGSGSTCYPQLTTVMSEINSGVTKYPGDQITYKIITSNISGTGNAGGVRVEVQLPIGVSLNSVTFNYVGDVGGPPTFSNISNDPNHPIFGDFNIAPAAQVIITLVAQLDCNILPGSYHSSAQAIYLDPSRTILDPERRISPLTNSFSGTKNNYETGSGESVPGSNYNGNLPDATTEDIKVDIPVITNNVIHPPLPSVLCIKGVPGQILGELPTGGTGSFSYQWQQSADNVTFSDIPGAVLKDFNAVEPTTESIYYRRKLYHLNCIQPNLSNVTFLKVIKTLPTVDFEVPDVCLKDGLATFINKTSISDGTESSLTYLWDFGDPTNATPINPNTSTAKDGSHIYTQTGIYKVSLTVMKEDACPINVEHTFRVNGSIPKADFLIQNNNNCSGQEIIFEDKASVDFGEITKIEWHCDIINDPLQIEIDQDPEIRTANSRIYKHAYPKFHQPATKTISVRMVVHSGISCSDEITKEVTLKAVPEVSFETIPPVCQTESPFQLTKGREIWGILPGKGQYAGPGVSPDGMFSPAVAGPGTHILSYSFLADNGCISEVKTQTITVFPGTTVDAGADQIILGGGQIQLNPIVTGSNLSYKWSPSTALDRDNIERPTASPTSNITYTLTVTTNEGCSASDDVSIKILQHPEIPNTFTPNGDQINDEWNIRYLASYPKATLSVFNRYGVQVFYAAGDIRSWDGKHKGSDLPVGTYYYILNPHNGQKTLSGSITILR